MECPHCQFEFEQTPHFFALGEDPDGTWQVSNLRCPACDRLIIHICQKDGQTYPAWPQGSSRPPLSAEVPADYAREYHTASRVIVHSTEASAAISRRLLHRVLAVKTGAGHGSLADQIRQAVIASDLPPYLKSALQTLTRIARIDADSPKSEHPDALSGAEPGEAEWQLEVLQALFDLYFVEPARMERKQADLEKLLAPPAPAPAVTAPAAPAPESATPAGTAAGQTGL